MKSIKKVIIFLDLKKFNKKVMLNYINIYILCRKRKRDDKGEMKVKKKVRFNLDDTSDEVSF